MEFNSFGEGIAFYLVVIMVVMVGGMVSALYVEAVMNFGMAAVAPLIVIGICIAIPLYMGRKTDEERNKNRPTLCK